MALFIKRLPLLLLLSVGFLRASSLTAQGQSAPADAASPQEQELRELRRELDELRERVERNEQRVERTEFLAGRRARFYGEVGIRYLGIFTDGQRPGGSEISRPEYRARLGVTGYLYDTSKHRFRYDLRAATQGEGEFPAPLGTPTLGWRPVEAFGTSSPIVFDRWHLHHTYKGWLRAGGGRFGTIFDGSELLFDQDLGLTGVYAQLDVGFLGGVYSHRTLHESLVPDLMDPGLISRLQLKGAYYFLAQRSLGLALPGTGDLANAWSLQLALTMRVPSTDTAITVAPGFHFFSGIDALAANVGTGFTDGTTNAVDAAGNVISKFRVADLYGELIFYEQRVASFKVYAHLASNFAAERMPGSGDRKAGAAIVGAQWGSLRLEEAGEFLLGFHYDFIQADAAVPEFNSAVYNTNYIGHGASMHIVLIPGVTTFVHFNSGIRDEEGINGVGRRRDGTTGIPSDDRETRWRIGVNIRF